MYKAAAQAEQFYTRSGSESTKGSRRGFALLGGGECATAVLTDKQRDEAERHALNSRLTLLAKELSEIRLELGRMRIKSGPAFFALIAQRNRIAAEKSEILIRVQEINNRIRAAKPKPNADAVPAVFMEVAREVLTQAQFTLILKAAFDRASKVEVPV